MNKLDEENHKEKSLEMKFRWVNGLYDDNEEAWT